MKSTGLMLRLARYVNAQLRLEQLTPQALVEEALAHMPEDLPPEYEQLIEELCRRVDPEWARRVEPPSVIP